MTVCYQCGQPASWGYTQHGEQYAITHYYCKNHSPKTKSSSGISEADFNRLRQNQESSTTSYKQTPVGRGGIAKFRVLKNKE
jgi:hypothetical protein